MQYFKHYSNASQSNSLTELIAKTGLDGYGRYWLLMETLCQRFNGDSDDIFVLSTRDLMRILGYYHLNHMSMYLQCVANVCSMSIECDKDVTSIRTSILLELQSRDFKKARTERAQTAPKNKIKNKIKNKDKEEEVLRTQHPLINLWNLNRGRLSEVKTCNDSRLKKVAKIWKDHTPEELEEAIRRIADSDFCNGKNDRAWVASFNFLLKPETTTKTLEGMYDNRIAFKRNEIIKNEALNAWANTEETE